MRAEPGFRFRLAGLLAAASIASGAAASPASAKLPMPDLSWPPAQADAPIDPDWISEHSTGLAGDYARDFASAVQFNAATVARYDDPGALLLPARGVLLRVLVDAEGRSQGFRVLRSSGNADYDRLVIDSLYADKPLLAPPPALLRGRPSLYVIGMFMVGYSRKVDNTGPLYAQAVMALDGRLPPPPRVDAAGARMLDAVRHDLTANPPAFSRPMEVVLRYVRGKRRIVAVQVLQSSGDAAFDAALHARALAIAGRFELPEQQAGAADWTAHYQFRLPENDSHPGP